MKKLIVTILLSMLSLTSYCDVIDIYYDNLPSLEESIHRFGIGSSCYNKIKGKECIFFTIGHYGANWSILVPSDDGYVVYSGTTQTDKVTTDTILNKDALLRWSFDTLREVGKHAIPAYQPLRITIWWGVTLYSSQGKPLFYAGSNKQYSGERFRAFNKVFGDLRYLLWWYSGGEDGLRTVLPEP